METLYETLPRELTVPRLIKWRERGHRKGRQVCTGNLIMGPFCTQESWSESYWKCGSWKKS